VACATVVRNYSASQRIRSIEERNPRVVNIFFFLRGVGWPTAMIKKKIRFSSYTYKEIQMGEGAKSYMRKDFLINEEMR
jgi:hypothetical protein